MESRLKERLTGAAILVALIVLLVPEMFRGPRIDAAAPASSGEGPPVRSYTIDLSNNPSSTAPLQPTQPPAAVRDAPAETGRIRGSAAGPPTVDTSEPHPVPVPAASGTVAVPPMGSTGASSANAAPAARVPAAPATAGPAGARAHPAAIAAASQLPGTHAGSGDWSVQLGLFAQHDNAERLAHAAQSKGFNATLAERDAKGLYRVRVGNLSDRAAALAMQERLRDQGFAAAVVPPH